MNISDGHRHPIPESGPALYLVYLILPVMRCDANAYHDAYTVPVLMSRN